MIVEVAWTSLAKAGEELCGDWVQVSRTPERLIVALSDGLGSGVKANILATLTTEIAISMLERGATIDEVIETLAATLPECQVRHLAYATFAIFYALHGQEAYWVTYDSPPLIWVRGGELLEVPGKERSVSGRTIREGRMGLCEGDYVVMVSDGYIHAGVGGLYRMGWGWKNIAVAVRRWASTQGDAYRLSEDLRSTCLKLYGGVPGDDATAVVMRVRARRRLTLLTGPPVDPAMDAEVARRVAEARGWRVICGGTTAQVVARELGRPLRVDWRRPQGEKRDRSRLPPVAHLEGFDLVTEGILTLSATVDRLRGAQNARDLPAGEGADLQLARLLLEADEIHVIIGGAINPQQLADVVRGKPMRQVYVEELIGLLRRLDKCVTIEHV